MKDLCCRRAAFLLGLGPWHVGMFVHHSQLCVQSTSVREYCVGMVVGLPVAAGWHRQCLGHLLEKG